MSAQNTFMTAIRASERGAYEYLPKPFDLKELIAIVGRALAEPKEKRAASAKSEELDAIPLVGRSPAMQEIYRVLARLMQTDLTVMISGESGTGKELVARALHDYGKRRAGAFVAINMAAIPRDLIESELFGHEKGAFTGANARSSGRFEQAEGGTLFLDEIGDMPMEAQTRLLRVLQQGEYTTVGGRTPIKSDVRIIAATNKDLRLLIQQGLFREDLFFRLNVVPLRLPPLRERSEDIPDLIRHFLRAGAARRPAAQAHRPGRAGAPETASLARQCARTGKPGAPAGGALSAGNDHRRGHRRRTGAAGAAGRRRGAAARRIPQRRGRAAPLGLFRRLRGRDAAGRALSPHLARDRISAADRRARPPPAATKSAPPTCSASTATPCARKSATSISRSTAAAINRAGLFRPRICRNSATLLYKSISAGGRSNPQAAQAFGAHLPPSSRPGFMSGTSRYRRNRRSPTRPPRAARPASSGRSRSGWLCCRPSPPSSCSPI